MKLEPYIMFSGRTAEALAYYQKTLNAEILMVLKFSDSPEPPPEGITVNPNQVMHAAFSIGGHTLMASDGCGETEAISGISLSLSVKTKEEAETHFNALAEAGEVTMPLSETFWSPLFGMVKDPFGIHWMVGVDQECGA